MDKIIFDEKEIIEALNRSGYLLESEISKLLSDSGFFVETNQVIKDPFTGKSREIDLTAEYYTLRDQATNNKCVSKARFVFEIKNNSAPIVLLTQFEHSPNIRSWDGLKIWETTPKGLTGYIYNDFHERLIESNRGEIFTQYCSFQRKKQNSELMALHPDNIHSGLAKITQYCEEAIEGRSRNEDPNGYFRKFIYLPVLLISEELYATKTNEDGELKIDKLESSILLYNYHYKGDPSMAFIHVVTKKGFPEFMNKVLQIENDIENEMIKLRKNVT